MAIRLEPLTPDNEARVRGLRRASGQERFVKTVEESLSDAQPHPEAWLRAAYDADELVGFVMLWDSFDKLGHMLWRLLVDAGHQRRGHGRAIVDAVAQHVRAQGATTLKVSAHEGDGGPRPFYESLGFVPTGEFAGDEVVFALPLVADGRAQMPQSE
jgi:diamine N-acetyltransferase